MFEMADQPVLCIGAGPVAVAKLSPFLEAGAAVTVIAPQVSDSLETSVTVINRVFQAGDIDRDPSPRIVVAATGHPPIDEQVAAEAGGLGVWCLRVDGGGLRGRSEVAVPAIVRHESLVIALTTGAPALSRHLRVALADLVDTGWGTAATILSEARADDGVRAALAEVAPTERRRRWRAAVSLVMSEGSMVVGAESGRATQARTVRALLRNG